MTKIVKQPDQIIATLLGKMFARIAVDLPADEWQGLRQSHLRVITSVAAEGSRITDLAEKLRMTKQGAGQLVATLVEAGLVQVESGQEDRRVRLVRRTAAGDGMVRRLHERFAELEDEWASEVGEAAYATFRNVVEQLARG